MNRIRFFILAAGASVSTVSNKGTIAELRQVHIEIKEEKIEGGLEKAMLSYQRFLEETPDAALTPEAIRRLADLKIEKEYGALARSSGSAGQAKAPTATPAETLPKAAPAAGAPPDRASAPVPVHGESDADFERRATQGPPGEGAATAA